MYASKTALCVAEEKHNTGLLLMCLLSKHLTFIKELASSSFLSHYFISNTVYKNYTSLFGFPSILEKLQYPYT